MVLIVLGVMHFFNLFVFSRIRRHTPPKGTTPTPGPETYRGFNEAVGG